LVNLFVKSKFRVCFTNFMDLSKPSDPENVVNPKSDCFICWCQRPSTWIIVALIFIIIADITGIIVVGIYCRTFDIAFPVIISLIVAGTIISIILVCMIHSFKGKNWGQSAILCRTGCHEACTFYKSCCCQCWGSCFRSIIHG
jgi:hypothetical protein